MIQALKQLKPDELWVLPCFKHTFQKALTAAEDRVKMAELMVIEMADPRINVNTIEIERKLSGSTLETLNILKTTYPEAEFAFLIGSDNLATFNKWENWQALLTQMKFYVYLRQGYAAIPWYEEMTLLESVEISEVSSTTIRNRLKKGLEIESLVPPKVEAYIKREGLYL